jgi:hypothetical protein
MGRALNVFSVRRWILVKRSIFFRILAVCLLPLIIIFSTVIFIINGIIYDRAVISAFNESKSYTIEAARRIDEGQQNVRGFLELLSNNLSTIDPSELDAAEKAKHMAKSLVAAAPYIGCVWFSFEPGTFLENERFSMDYVRFEGNVVELANFDEDNLDDPALAPWYFMPFHTGDVWIETADFYDYELGDGARYSETVSGPMRRGGRIIGVVGIDTFYDYTFQFLDEKQMDGEQLILILTEEG